MKVRASSLLTGAILGAISAASAGYIMGDSRMRRRICRQGRQMLDKVEDTIDNFTS